MPDFRTRFRDFCIAVYVEMDIAMMEMSEAVEDAKSRLKDAVNERRNRRS